VDCAPRDERRCSSRTVLSRGRRRDDVRVGLPAEPELLRHCAMAAGSMRPGPRPARLAGQRPASALRRPRPNAGRPARAQVEAVGVAVLRLRVHHRVQSVESLRVETVTGRRRGTSPRSGCRSGSAPRSARTRPVCPAARRRRSTALHVRADRVELTDRDRVTNSQVSPWS